MIDRAFIDATTLLLQIVPRVFATDRLALKGGTAINLYLVSAYDLTCRSWYDLMCRCPAVVMMPCLRRG